MQWERFKEQVSYDELVDTLYWMCFQYLREKDGEFYHAGMMAGEHAENVLNRLELIKDGKLIDISLVDWN